MEIVMTGVWADWLHVKNACRTTVGKSESFIEATKEFKRKLIISEHSPIRRLRFSWKWTDLKSWVATHFCRHMWECYISTQRSDRTGENRDEISQSAPVIFDGEMNGQNAIDTARKRLCKCSSKETRQAMMGLKQKMLESDDLVELSEAMVPNCIYRFGCSEPFSNCGFFKSFIEYCEKNNKGDLSNIQNRYDAYNEMISGNIVRSTGDKNERDTTGNKL